MDLNLSVNSPRARILSPGLIALGVSIGCLLIGPYLPFLRAAENWTQDIRVAVLSESRPVDQEIVVVRVTEETLAGLTYRSPVDRRFLAVLLKTLESKGARLIGLDVLLDRATDFDKDLELRETLLTLDTPVIVATVHPGGQLTLAQTAYLRDYLSGIPTADVAVLKDFPDGVIRRAHLGGEKKPTFAAAMTLALGHELPATDETFLDYRVAPRAEESAFLMIDAHVVSHMPDPVFRDKIVLIGADLPLDDRHATPHTVLDGKTMPGVLIHAHTLSQLLEGRSVASAAQSGRILTVLGYSAFGILLAFLNLPLIVTTGLMVGVLAVTWTGTFAVYRSSGVLIPVITPSVAFLLASTIVYAYLKLGERRQRRFITDAFRHYLAPTIIDDLIAHPEQLRLSGEQREMTFLFTDIAGFTALTDSLEPEVLVRLLIDYLSGCFQIVFDHGGTIDKIVGDALHVLFNAPSPQPDHAERAIRCALALDLFCAKFIRGQEDGGITFGETRIGINTGTATVGNFGGDQRFDYTAHGTPVNMAARLESANKYFGTRICVSATTADQVAAVEFRPIARVVLKGLTQPVQLYEPIVSSADKELIGEYLEAYSLLDADPDGALAAFSNLKQRSAHDPLVNLHLNRLTAGETGDELIMKEK